MKTPLIILTALLLIFVACKEKKENEVNSDTIVSSYTTTGSIERISSGLDKLISKNAVIEIIAEGFTWTEGPLWVSEGNYLLFSDIPANVINKWTEDDGVSKYLYPSGYTGKAIKAGEPGSNGLIIDAKGKLVLCQHGDRKMAMMLPDMSRPRPVFGTIIDNYQGKKFNSPNDAVFDKNGNLYFTDPPYGLEGKMDDPKKELSFQGVYRFSSTGELTLISDKMSRPNGIGLSPDEKTLYVSNSDGEAKIWMAFSLDEHGKVIEEKIFYDATEDKNQGYPDGLKVDKAGNIWATGPGGVIVFNAKGKILGRIRTGQATSNCAFDSDERTLYMTCDDYLMRVRLK